MGKLVSRGRVTHICVSKLSIIGSDNGLSPGRRQAIIWTNAGIVLIWTLGTNFSEILSKIHAFSFKKMYLKMSSTKWRPFCVGLNVLRFPNILPGKLWERQEKSVLEYWLKLMILSSRNELRVERDEVHRLSTAGNTTYGCVCGRLIKIDWIG